MKKCSSPLSDEPRSALQKFIAAEIDTFVSEWEKADRSSPNP